MKSIRLQIFLYAILAGTVLIAYYPAFRAGFTNWDDPAYVTENDLIKNIDGKNISEMFTSFRNGHYHPLTWISLAADQKIGGGKPWQFHASSIFLHVLNTMLLFFFLFKMTKEKWLSFFTALLFGIHPMSVEAVAWVAERKTVLYVFFFILSLIFYLRYTDSKKLSFYLLAFVFFILSCFSKSMAVVLPVVLILIDYYKGRKLISFAILKNKIPFLLVSVLFGVLSVLAQKEVIQPEHLQGDTTGIGWGAWSFILYLIKMIIPFGLSALYPYPPDGSLDIFRSALGFISMIGFIFLVIYYYRKENKAMVFGLLFIAANLFFVLKFFNIPAGAYYMADRYAYLPVAGMWIVLFVFLSSVFKKKLNSVNIVLGFISFIFIFISNINAGTWKNSISLWTKVIEKNDYATIAFINRGNAYRDEGKYEKAISDYNNAERINPLYSVIFTNRGYVSYMNGQYKDAVKDFSRSLAMDNSQYEVHYNRGLAFYSLKEYDKALADYNSVVKDRKDFYKAYIGIGNVYLAKKNDSLALDAYNRSISINKINPESYYNKGNIYANRKMHKEALAEYNKAIDIVKYNADYLVNRASTYYYLNEFDKAMADFNLVLSKDPSHNNARVNRGTLALRMGNYQVAFDDFSDIIKRDPKNADAYLKRGMTILNSNKPSDACKDFSEAYRLGHPMAANFLNTYCK